MNPVPRKITLDEWDHRYAELQSAGLVEPFYGGTLRRHVEDGDYRLRSLQFDNSPASLRLWNFLLTEEERLHRAQAEGALLIGTMKDLGTVPVMAYSLSGVRAFYPDGAWWIPCVMEYSAGLLKIADSLGIDESFCPVRAMLGAFLTGNHFPIPDYLLCSVGAVCDDFSAIAQRLQQLGYDIFWWEVPHRRSPASDENTVHLPGGFSAPELQVAWVKSELLRIREALEQWSGQKLNEEVLMRGIQAANRIRRILSELRRWVFTAEICPLPALELLIAEMLAIHFCSDREECRLVLEELLTEVKRRILQRQGIIAPDAVRVFWVNPVADLRAMNLLEECGGRICGTEYLFCHALDEIPEDLLPLEALARMALADPMVGSSQDRAQRIIQDIQTFGAETLVVSRIPGASHCAVEGQVIRAEVESQLHIPCVEIEVPPLCDAVSPALRTRLQALVETVRERRKA